MEHQWRIVHRDALEHRTHSLAADLRALVVVRRCTDVERATADELNRVGEVRQCQQTARGALRGVVDVVEVHQSVWRDVQNLLDVVAVIRQDLGELGQLGNLVDQRLVVLVQEALDVTERLIQGAQGLIQIGRAISQHL
jgi:hypothetical protein